MKKYLTLLTLWICPAVLVAQKHYNPVSGAYQYDRIGTTNVLSIPHGCGFPVTIPISDAGKTNMYIDTCAHRMYHYDALGGWRRVADSSDVGSGPDTSSEVYDTVLIFNYTPSGTSLPPGFGGTAAHSVSSGALSFVGNTTSAYVDSTYIVDSIGTLTEGAIMTAMVRYNTVTATDTGISIGWLSANPLANESTMGGYGFNQGNTFGTASVPLGSAMVLGTRVSGSYTGVAISSSQQTNINAGDVLKYTLTRTGLNYTMTVVNITRNWTITYTAVTNPLSVPFTANNTAYPAIFWHGGGFSVTNWTYSIIKPHRCDFAIEGNSITYGQAASDQNGKWANQVGNRKNNVISGGGTDLSASVRMRTTEILKTKAKYAAIMIGGNDVLFGTPLATWESNLRHIRDTLTLNGVTVIWLYPTPRTGANMTPLVAFLDSAVDFTNDKKIRGTFYGLLDPNTFPNLNPIYDGGDGTHPNDLGHFRIAAIINDSLVQWGYLAPAVNSHEYNQVILQGGRRAGQAIYGANTDGGSLYFGSTLSINKGNINMGNSLYVLDGPGFVGMGGNSAPQYVLDVYGPLVSSVANPTPGAPEYSARFTAALAYRSSNYGLAVVDPSSAGTSINGLVISGHPGTPTEPRFELSSDFSPTTGESSVAHNFYIDQYPANGQISLFTTNNGGGAVGNIVVGPIFGPYTALFDMTNHRLGLNGVTSPLYSLDVRDHINGFTEPAGTNNTLMASTAFVTLDNAIANNSTTTHTAQFTGGSYVTVNGTTFVLSNGVFAQLGGFDSLSISGVTGGPPLFHIEQNGVANYTNNYGSLFTSHSLIDRNWADSAYLQNQNSVFQTFNAAISGNINMQYLVTRNATTPGGSPHWTMQNGSTQRWAMGLNATESGSNTGSNWYLARANDAGTLVDFPITISRATGVVTVQDGMTVNGPIVGNGSTPAIAAGTGAGTSPTVTMTGSQHSGSITITTGTTPAASATVATVTFTSAFPTKGVLILTPLNGNAAALTGNATVYVSAGTATTATISVGSTALAASTSYQYWFSVSGY